MDPKSQDEECHSSESGWTMYIGSPSNGEEDEMNCEDDFDEDDDDVGRGRRKNIDDDDDDDNDDTDDSMASDASSGPSHHIIRNANKNPIPKDKGNGKSGSNNKASMKKGSLKNQDKGGYSVFSAKGAKVPSNGEKVKKSIWKGKGK
ncbi:protein SOB FIVE-LIKE 3 [Capsicum chacoense]